jgi:hypothetical protein
MTTGLRRQRPHQHRADHLVIEHDELIGRIYEERYVPVELRWFWSITEHVDPALAITTNGKAAQG